MTYKQSLENYKKKLQKASRKTKKKDIKEQCRAEIRRVNQELAELAIQEEVKAAENEVRSNINNLKNRANNSQKNSTKKSTRGINFQDDYQYHRWLNEQDAIYRQKKKQGQKRNQKIKGLLDNNTNSSSDLDDWAKEYVKNNKGKASSFVNKISKGVEEFNADNDVIKNMNNPFFSPKKKLAYVLKNAKRKEVNGETGEIKEILDIKKLAGGLTQYFGPQAILFTGVRLLQTGLKNLADSTNKVNKQFTELNKSLTAQATQSDTKAAIRNVYDMYSNALDAAHDFRVEENSNIQQIKDGLSIASTLTKGATTLDSTLKKYTDYINKGLEANAATTMAGWDLTAQEDVSIKGRKFAREYVKEYAKASGLDLTNLEAQATELYQQMYSAFIDAVVNGGTIAGTEYTTEGLEAYGYKTGNIIPYVEYGKGVTGEAAADWLLTQFQTKQNEGNAALNKLVKTNVQQSRLLKNIGGSLYSFDEVVTNNAVNEAENLVEQQEMNSTLLKVSEDANAAADEAANNALIEQRKTDAVKKAIEDDKLTAEEIRELQTMMDDTELAKRLLDLQGIPATEEAINSVLTMLNTTLESGIPINLGSLSESLDTFSKAMEGGIKLDGNIIVNGHEYTKEQSDAFRLAIADGVFSNEEYDKLLEMGWDRADIIAILATLKNIEVQTKDLDKVVKARTEFDVLKDMLSNPLYSQKAIEEQRKMLQKYAAETGDGLTMNPLTNMLQIKKKYGSVQLHNALNGNGSLNSNTVTQQQEDEEIARLMAANNVLEAIYGNGQAAGGIGTDDSVIRAFEKGPEAIIPLNDSGIQFMSNAIKNANIEGGLGGGDVHVNLTLSGLNISDKRDWEEVGLKIGQVIQNYKNRTGGI